MTKKKIARVKTWTVEEVRYEDGTVELNRKNEGFHPLELMGLCALAQHEILQQIRGQIKPDVTTRTVVKD